MTCPRCMGVLVYRGALGPNRLRICRVCGERVITVEHTSPLAA